MSTLSLTTWNFHAAKLCVLKEDTEGAVCEGSSLKEATNLPFCCKLSETWSTSANKAHAESETKRCAEAGRQKEPYQMCNCVCVCFAVNAYVACMRYHACAAVFKCLHVRKCDLKCSLILGLTVKLHSFTHRRSCSCTASNIYATLSLILQPARTANITDVHNLSSDLFKKFQTTLQLSLDGCLRLRWAEKHREERSSNIINSTAETLNGCLCSDV